MARSGFDLQEEGESLVVKKVEGAHEGRYTCIASNTAGSAEETFSLQVLCKLELSPDVRCVIVLWYGLSW